MGKREFSIKVYKDIDWEIGLKDVDSFESYPPLGGSIDYGFGISRSQDKKIAYLFDIDIRDEDLELALKDERFLEVCNFELVKIDSEDKEYKREFSGNFIDSLEEIKKDFYV